ncbi:unnamed protein product [Arctogadus glacialis]
MRTDFNVYPERDRSGDPEQTNDVPARYREEGEMIVPVYGYFIRGAQTTFSGVLRDRQWKYILCRMTDHDCAFENL